MKVLKITENKDNSAAIDIELSSIDENKFKIIAKIKKQKYTKEFIEKTLLRAIKNYIKKENLSE